MHLPGGLDLVPCCSGPLELVPWQRRLSGRLSSGQPKNGHHRRHRKEDPKKDDDDDDDDLSSIVDSALSKEVLVPTGGGGVRTLKVSFTSLNDPNLIPQSGERMDVEPYYPLFSADLESTEALTSAQWKYSTLNLADCKVKSFLDFIQLSLFFETPQFSVTHACAFQPKGLETRGPIRKHIGSLSVSGKP